MDIEPTRAENKFTSKLRDVSIFTNETWVLYGSSLYNSNVNVRCHDGKHEIYTQRLCIRSLMGPSEI
jgi:hypothetical protein